MAAENIGAVVEQSERDNGDDIDEESIDHDKFNELHHDLSDRIKHNLHLLISLPKQSKNFNYAEPSKVEIDKFIAKRHKGNDRDNGYSQADHVAFVSFEVALMRKVNPVDEATQNDF